MLDRMQVGDVAKKHHIQLRGADGELRFEECFTRDGFDGPYTILYHLRRPHTQRVAQAEHGWAAPDRRRAERAAREAPLPAPASSRTQGGPQIDARIAAALQRRPHRRRRVPDRATIRSTSSTATPTSSSTSTRAAARCARCSATSRSRRATTCSCRAACCTASSRRATQHWFWFVAARAASHVPKQWRNDVGQLRMDAPY